MEKPNPKKSELTRQFIIEKAAPIFNKKGIAGTSLTDLTQATGLTKGSIYGNFKDKDDVAICVFQYNVDNLMVFLKRAMDKEDGCVGKLLALPNAYRRLYEQIIAYGGCPVMNTAIEADDTHTTLRRLTVDVIQQIKNDITELIENGKQSGDIKASIETVKTADIIISLIEGGLFLSKLTGEKNYMMHSLEQVETLIRSSATCDFSD